MSAAVMALWRRPRQRSCLQLTASVPLSPPQSPQPGGAIVKTCGSACHATSCSPPVSSGRSTSLPFSKVAPARTRATRCGAFTSRQRACALSIILNAIARAIVKTCGSACHAACSSPPELSGRSTSLPLSKWAPARTSATRCGAFTALQRFCADSMSLKAIATPAAREPGPLVTR